MAEIIWSCPNCSEELGLYNAYCEYCWYDHEIKVYNPDKYYIREIRIYHLTVERPQGARMTPQEELFATLFNGEKLLVKDMDILTLRAHREELAKIAFEARARLTAVDDEEKDRRKINSDGKPSGLERSLDTDETTTNAINAIKDRQKRMSKQDKIQAGLEKLGISTADASKLMSAGALLGRLKNKTTEQPIAPTTKDNKDITESSAKQVFNPFAKKSE